MLHNLHEKFLSPERDAISYNTLIMVLQNVAEFPHPFSFYSFKGTIKGTTVSTGFRNQRVSALYLHPTLEKFKFKLVLLLGTIKVPMTHCKFTLPLSDLLDLTQN